MYCSLYLGEHEDEDLKRLHILVIQLMVVKTDVWSVHCGSFFFFFGSKLFYEEEKKQDH